MSCRSHHQLPPQHHRTEEREECTRLLLQRVEATEQVETSQYNRIPILWAATIELSRRKRRIHYPCPRPTLRATERQLAPTALDQRQVPVPERESRRRSVFEVARSSTRLGSEHLRQVDDGFDVLPFCQRPNGGRGHTIKYPLYHILLRAPRNTEADVRPPQKMDGAVREYWTQYAADAQSRGQEGVLNAQNNTIFR
ncbi:unnamed protein product [Sphacelaria rigidula]